MIFLFQHTFLGESKKFLYIVTNECLISSIFNYNFLYQSVINVNFNYYI